MAMNPGEAFSEGAQLAVWDLVVIVLYFVAIIVIAFFASRRKGNASSVSGYFLADKSMNFLLVGASLYASNIGSSQFVGEAGSGAASGLSIGAFELMTLLILLLLGWVFVPVYMSAGVYTMPEYLRKRFGGQRIRIYMSVLSLILTILTRISIDLYAGALFIKQALNWNLYASICVLLAISALFTIFGGLTAVIWTEMLQTILMIVGALILMVISFERVGGYSAIFEKFPHALPDPEYQGYGLHNESCSAVGPYYNHLFRPADDEELPWPGTIFGLFVSALWYWCTDQIIVQRALSAKNLGHAKAGCVLASLLKIIPFFVLVLPGMAARILFPNEVACSDPAACERICGASSGCSNIAYPLLVLRLMPVGLTGLMFSVMLAALMSSLTSIFNSSSTIFVIDLWCRMRKKASDIEQIIVGRIFIVVLVVISILWIPFIEKSQNAQLFHYMQSVTSYLSPPIAAAYVLGIFYDRVNESGTFWGLIIGLIIGIIRFVVEFVYELPPCADKPIDTRPFVVSKVHYTHFGILLFVISCLIMIAISFMTKKIDEVHLVRLTYWTRFSDKIRINLGDKNNIDLAAAIQPNGLSKTADDGVPNLMIAQKSVVSTSSNESSDASSFAVEDEIEKNMAKDGFEIVNGPPATSKTTEKPHRHWLHVICFVTETQTQEELDSPKVISKEEETRMEVEAVRETQFWSFCNGLAGTIALVISGFLWGYYA